jgi:hypothetical protein
MWCDRDFSQSNPYTVWIHGEWSMTSFLDAPHSRCNLLVKLIRKRIYRMTSLYYAKRSKES